MNGLPDATMTALIGAYTERMSHVDGRADGISTVTLGDGVGEFGIPVVAAVARNPAWVTVSADGTRAYAVGEVDEFDGEPVGRVYSYEWDAARGRLEPIDESSSGGASPTHLAVDPTGRFVVVANFNGGSVTVIELDERGGLARTTDVMQHQGSGLDPVRQGEPHPHQVVFDPVMGELLVPDLGIDRVVRYRIDDEGRLAPAGEPIHLADGSGPRHLAFGPRSESLFVLGELDSTVSVFRRGGTGGFEPVGVLSTLPAGYAGRNLTAGFVATSDGRRVFASNRGHDSVATFEWDDASGSLRLTELVPCGGREPRALAVTPDGGRLIVANQNSSLLAVFAIEATGLVPVGSIPSPSPACVMFADPRLSG